MRAKISRILRGYAGLCGMMGLLLTASVAIVRAGQAAEIQAETYPVTLQFVPSGAAQSVSIAGTFNGWSNTAAPLTKQPDGKTWRITLKLEPDVYQYKFVVNGKDWTPDPNAPRFDDGNGNINSLLTVAPADYSKLPGKRGDGLITASALRHVPNARYVVRIDKTHVALTLRTRRDDVQEARVVLAEYSRIEMRRIRSDALFDYWRSVVPVGNADTMHYHFAVKDGKFQAWLQDDANIVKVANSDHPFTLNLKDFPVFETPEWVRDAVFYQIFPDRFANGDKSNDPKDVQAWGSKPTWFAWQGGDLQGVVQHTDYLKTLGINALYFNPIFNARSNHGYDTTDYLHVHPNFGTNADLKAVTEAAHKQGWHVILDAVFNHTGVEFTGFKDLQAEGAKSSYRNWYFVRGFPIEVRDGQNNYDGWYGSPWMPKLNVVNPATRDYLLNVGTYWIKNEGIDGWRLDAANEVNPEFWRQFRKTIRAANPNAYIVGEYWDNASFWLQGDQWDAAMNYPWCFAVRDFFALDKSKPSQFDARLSQIRDFYPPAATATMFNILDSHDTDRIRTVCGNNTGKEFQAVLFQMTYPGAPCVYYGDEIGMEGGRDPDNRRAMAWDKVTADNATLNFYKKTIALRNRHVALRRGEFQTVLTDDAKGIYAFARTAEKERAVVVFNRSDAEQEVVLPAAPNGRPATDWLDTGVHVRSEKGQWTFTLPPRGMALIGTSR